MVQFLYLEKLSQGKLDQSDIVVVEKTSCRKKKVLPTVVTRTFTVFVEGGYEV